MIIWNWLLECLDKRLIDSGNTHISVHNFWYCCCISFLKFLNFTGSCYSGQYWLLKTEFIYWFKKSIICNKRIQNRPLPEIFTGDLEIIFVWYFCLERYVFMILLTDNENSNCLLRKKLFVRYYQEMTERQVALRTNIFVWYSKNSPTHIGHEKL